ncbi:MAG: methylenetetrahydrofolate--tRNA-(uracil(54)-C(5))-methyltransferase (FADH(2)-oxidizing) TrmFO [Oscillospiraceae bacterium]|nr:methylenetetrahydrofolate--tRNA-(uracil(54)-C(5))-methyltransferase (FADH(2)-oxidizing) TrmFO [Oscillospiraceae bacterium]
MSQTVKVIGAGLAGCEAAWQLAGRGIHTELYEMKPHNKTPAHSSDNFAELVCSNSLRACDISNAVGLLKEEMRKLGSLIIESAYKTRIPAGGALAVDREKFAALITDKIINHPKIEIKTQEITDIPDGFVIIATGPLTSDALAVKIKALMPDKKMLSFFDAAAPIVTYESIDLENAYFASRYDKGDADYINCPMNEDEYKAFYSELINAQIAPLHGFEDKTVFEGCMPIEVMARRGEDTMRFGPLKPVGLRDPKTGKTPYAVVQLRRDNIEGTLYNLVGFQTNLKFPEQKRVFAMVPALKNSNFVRYGVMHRNTYIDAPNLLDRYNRLRANPKIRFAGQITGVEGYVESASSGLLTGLETVRELLGLPQIDFPKTTAIGALSLYISQQCTSHFQPMNINFGLIEPLDVRVKGKKDKNKAIAERSLKQIDEIIERINE